MGKFMAVQSKFVRRARVNGEDEGTNNYWRRSVHNFFTRIKIIVRRRSTLISIVSRIKDQHVHHDRTAPPPHFE